MTDRQIEQLIEQVLAFQYSISELAFKQKLIQLSGSTEAARQLYLSMETNGLLKLHQINNKTKFVSRSDEYTERLISDLAPHINEASPPDVISQYRYCTSGMSAPCKWPYLYRVKMALNNHTISYNER